jgi:hypothetical protein
MFDTRITFLLKSLSENQLERGWILILHAERLTATYQFETKFALPNSLNKVSQTESKNQCPVSGYLAEDLSGSK